MKTDKIRRQDDSWNRWRHCHLFKGKSGDFGCSIFFPSEAEARAFSRLIEDTLSSWRWTEVRS